MDSQNNSQQETFLLDLPEQNDVDWIAWNVTFWGFNLPSVHVFFEFTLAFVNHRKFDIYLLLHSKRQSQIAIE